MKRKKSEGKRLLCTMLTATIVLSLFTAGLGVLPVSADPVQVSSVNRDLPDYVQPGETFTVTLTQIGFLEPFNIGVVNETLPEGFEYVVGSYEGGAPQEKVIYDPANRTLKVPFCEDYSIAYDVTVTAASEDQTAVFSGTYRALVGDPFFENGTVGRDTEVIVDGTPPETYGHNPAKGATGVPVDTNIVVHVTDNYEVNPSTIAMTVNGFSVSPSKVPDPGTNDWLVTYDPSVNFGYGEEVTVTIDAADKAGNAMTTDAYSFTTQEEGADTTAPAAITDLATSNPTISTIDLAWTAPGDDGTTGTATAYDIRYREGAQIATEAQWSLATPCTGEPAPKSAGSAETFTVIGLSADTTYYFAIKTMDEVPNWSPLSNDPSGTTLPSGEDTTPPAVSNPTADPEVIPDDTDNNPLWGESSTLTVTVTDESAITSVTIDLSSIGGSAVQAMTDIGGNIWSVTTNASNGTDGWTGAAYVPYQLQVNATDEHGLSNTAVSIPLTVMKNGDVSGNGAVTLYDATYISKWYLGETGFETIIEGVADVSGNGAVTLYDATYISKWYLGETGFETLK